MCRTTRPFTGKNEPVYDTVQCIAEHGKFDGLTQNSTTTYDHQTFCPLEEGPPCSLDLRSE